MRKFGKKKTLEISKKQNNTENKQFDQNTSDNKDHVYTT